MFFLKKLDLKPACYFQIVKSVILVDNMNTHGKSESLSDE